MNIPDDPVIQELIVEFVDTWIEDLDRDFNRLIEEKNGDDLYRLAHTLKGSCFQFGLDEIAELGITLMAKTKENDWEAAKGYEKPLKDKFREVKEMLNQ
jgi:HPt (histidine-containing phosphotransfer) domain-containing protein